MNSDSKNYVDVSLCFTTFNEQSSIHGLLLSIEAQTVLPREIVICDGGSTDDTIRIINDFKSKTRLKINLIECEERVNIATGRNLAILNSVHEVIAVTDAGCILDEDWLFFISRPLLDSGDELAIVGGFYRPLIQNDFQIKLSYVLFTDAAKYNSSNFIPSSRSIAFKKSMWSIVQGYPEYLKQAGEDTLFILKAKKFGYGIFFEQRAFVYWNMREDLAASRRVHYSYGYGEGEAGLFVWKYLFYFIALFFPFILVLKRRKYKYFLLQYLLIFEMLRGWFVGRFRKLILT